jgi:hypothetical protein
MLQKYTGGSASRARKFQGRMTAALTNLTASTRMFAGCKTRVAMYLPGAMRYIDAGF